MATGADAFPDGDERPSDPPRSGERLVVDLDGFEGPLDLLLALARAEKLDLHRISILALAEQYLAYIAAAGRRHLEIAADYLVMAAWLAYLKSRLLLPEPASDPGAEDDTPAEMAEALARQLRRLEAIRQAAAQLHARPLLGRDVFPRGDPDLPSLPAPALAASLAELLSAYGDIRRRTERLAPLAIARPAMFTIEAALARIAHMIGTLPGWSTLASFLPPEFAGAGHRPAALAATLVASLELARTGAVELRQDRPFGPILLRPTGR